MESGVPELKVLLFCSFITMAFWGNQPNVPQMFMEDMYDDEMTEEYLRTDPEAAERYVKACGGHLVI
jgi:hypothetical protein